MMADGADAGTMSRNAGEETGKSGERAGVIHLPFNGGLTIAVAVDRAVVASVTSHTVELYGISGHVAVCVDTYDSAPAAAVAGKERYVRLLHFGRQEELWHCHVHSDVEGIAVGDPLLSWSDDRSGFTIHLTSHPEVTVTVDDDGAVHVAS